MLRPRTPGEPRWEVRPAVARRVVLSESACRVLPCVLTASLRVLRLGQRYSTHTGVTLPPGLHEDARGLAATSSLIGRKWYQPIAGWLVTHEKASAVDGVKCSRIIPVPCELRNHLITVLCVEYRI